MRRLPKSVIVAMGLLALPDRHADAQVAADAHVTAQPKIVSVDPASPRWGEPITITAEPNGAAPESDRFDGSDHLFAVLSTFRHGTARTERLWTPMTWDGRRFVAHLTLPQGCEAANAGVATAERAFGNTRRSFACRSSDGTLPPGAMIEGLVWGGRDRSNWQADVAADVAALRPDADHGWEHAVIWLYRRAYDRSTFTREEFLRDVERVDREETNRTAGLLSSLVYGYDGAGETGKAFDRLKELCDRFPASEHAPRGLYFASAASVNHPEFEAELNRLLAQVAVRAPENIGLRESMFRLVTKTSGVPLSTIRGIATRWMRDDPADMQPHYLLAVALSNASGPPDQQAEAEALVSAAIELTMRPHPYDAFEQRSRQSSFELRSRLRSARGDLVGAVADARTAQLVARDKAAADDMSVEADLWRRLGFGRKAEDLAWEAYRLGSLKAEALLKSTYVARTGGDTGFSAYLIARLRERGASAATALRPTPSFSATTLDGAKVESSTLEDRVTVLDFWFINCPPCRVERPKLNEIVAEFGDKVRFVGFALDSPEALKTYLASNPYKYEVVPRSQQIADAFGVTSFPAHMVIDRSGRIVWLSGSDDDRIERLRAVIFRVLASQPAKPE